MTLTKRMKLKTIREKLLETYRESYSETLYNKIGNQQLYQYYKGKMIGLSQALIYLGINSTELELIRENVSLNL